MSHTKKVAAEFKRTIFPVVSQLTQSVVTDAATDPLSVAFRDFLLRVAGISTKTIEKNITRTLQGVEKFQREQFRKNVNSVVGVDIGKLLKPADVSKEVRAAVKENMKLIKSIGPSYSERGHRIIKDSLLSGKDDSSIKDRLLDLGGFDERYKGTEERRAKTIARDQTQKTMNAIDRVRQKKVGIKYYFWEATRDSKTRKEHAKYNGKRFSWDEPPSDGHPGDAVQCRCHARPDTKDLLATLEAL